jgi:hypothetical protein
MLILSGSGVHKMRRNGRPETPEYCSDILDEQKWYNEHKQKGGWANFYNDRGMRYMGMPQPLVKRHIEIIPTTRRTNDRDSMTFVSMSIFPGSSSI